MRVVLWSIIVLLCCSCVVFLPRTLVLVIDRSHLIENNIRLDRELLEYWNGTSITRLSTGNTGNRITRISLVLPRHLPFVASYTGYIGELPVLHGTIILSEEALLAHQQATLAASVDFSLEQLGALLVRLAHRGYELSRIDLARLSEEIRKDAHQHPGALVELNLLRAIRTDSLHKRIVSSKRFSLPVIIERELLTKGTWRFFSGQVLSSESALGAGLYYLFLEGPRVSRDDSTSTLVEVYVDSIGRYSYVYLD